MAQRSTGRAQGVARIVLTPVFRTLWRATTEGLDNIPGSGGAIIAPNHISVLDSFFLPLVLPRRITYVGKSEYMDDWKTRYLFPAMGMIPIDRCGGDAAIRALDAAAERLDAGELFGIYPEGTRSRDGRLHKGHTGIARLALRTGTPIVPAGIIGTDDCQRPDAKLPSPFKRVHIRFGHPIDVSRYAEHADDRLVLRQITDEVLFEIRNLSGQEYVDAYATKPSSRPVVTPSIEAEPSRAAVGGGDAERVHGEPAASGASPEDAPEHTAEVIQFPDRWSASPDRRHPSTAEVPAAGFAPSAGLPSTERAASLAVVPPPDDDGVERRSSSTVLKVRPLVGV